MRVLCMEVSRVGGEPLGHAFGWARLQWHGRARVAAMRCDARRSVGNLSRSRLDSGRGVRIASHHDP